MAIGEKILSFLTGGFAEKAIGLIDQKVADKDLATKLKSEFQTLIAQQQHELNMAVSDMQSQIIAGQVDVNKIDAASGSLFKGGWRPMVGWICAGALGYQMIIRPLLAWVSGMYAWMPPPSLEMDTLLTLLFAILGLGAYRTYERRTGVISKGE